MRTLFLSEMSNILEFFSVLSNNHKDILNKCKNKIIFFNFDKFIHEVLKFILDYALKIENRLTLTKEEISTFFVLILFQPIFNF